MQKKTSQKGLIQTYILLAISVVGMGFSMLLTNHYYQVRGGTAGFRSFCNLSQGMNCDAVAASPFAELIAGLPLSSFSTGWFLSLGILTLLALAGDWKKDATRGVFGVSLFGSLISVIYFFVMAFVLKTYCVYCLLIDGLWFVALGLAWSEKPFGPGKMDFGKIKTMGMIVLGSLFVAVVIGKSMDTLTTDRATLAQMSDAVLSTAPVPVKTGPEFPSLGNPNAPVTIAEFSDFQCPYCRIGAMLMNTLLNRYPNELRIVFRNFPLDPTCNPQVQHSMHPAACEAAKVSYCAFKQGKFREVYEEIFERQATLALGKPTEIAKSVGVDLGQLTACIASPDTLAAITRDIEEAKQLGVGSTPTFFVNGRKVEGVYPLPVWNSVIESLAKQK